MPSDKDIRESASVIVIDQALAYRLFPGAKAVGQTLSMGTKEWIVIGVIRPILRFGEVNDSVAYIPITAVFDWQMQPQTLEIRIRRGNNTPTAIMKSMVTEENEDGTWTDLAVEKEKAMV